MLLYDLKKGRVRELWNTQITELTDMCILGDELSYTCNRHLNAYDSNDDQL